MISVVVPVYKVEDYLDRCVQSIVNQTYCDLEIILVDDGSPDRSGELCDQWAVRDSRIKVVHQKNGGLSAARNAGIEHSSGEYLMFIDSDDYIAPNMAQRLHEAIQSENADVAVCNFRYVSDSDIPEDVFSSCSTEKYQFQERSVMDGRNFLLQMKADHAAASVIAVNKLYRRICFDSNRYVVGHFHEDEYMIYPLMYALKKVVIIPFVGYFYYRRSESIMGVGVRYADMLDMFIRRCEFCMSYNDRELTERAQTMLTQHMYRAKNNIPAAQLRVVRKRRIQIALKMYQKGWITLPLLVKRMAGSILG